MEYLKETTLWIVNWKWVLILATALLSSVAVVLIKNVLVRLQSSLEKRKINGFIKSLFAQHLETIIAWLIITTMWSAVLGILELPTKAAHFLDISVQLIQSLLFICLAYKASDAIGEVFQKYADKAENSLDDQLVVLARKTIKIFVVVFGILMAVQGFGFNVVSILAGLGIGGLAIAFAAQDTVANLFGSVTIILDQPFQVGDWIKITDTEGIVEEIGFRSTRIRTFYNSVVTIPNSIMAKEKIDNFQKRHTRRIRFNLGITYDCSPERISGFIDAVKYSLYHHPKILKENIRVYFTTMGDFSLQILVQYFISLGTAEEELQIQQDSLFEIMQIAQKLDVSFAFPTQTILLQKQDDAGRQEPIFNRPSL